MKIKFIFGSEKYNRIIVPIIRVPVTKIILVHLNILPVRKLFATLYSGMHDSIQNNAESYLENENVELNSQNTIN